MTDLRDGESRDDTAHASRTAAQLAEADADTLAGLEDDDRLETDGGTSSGDTCRVVPPSKDRRNYSLHHHDGSFYAVRENGDTEPELFVRTGQTRNVRALATADAVIHDGLLLDVLTDTGTIILQDPWAGIQDRFAPVEWRDPPFAMFDRVDAIFNGGDS